MSRSSLPKSCRDCPLANEAHVRGFGSGDGPMIIGEAPGYTEVKQGQPFVGEAGKLLRVTLNAAGIDPNDVFMTNSVLCHPDKNATPKLEMVDCCSTRLQKEVALVRPTKILAVGNIALTAVLRASKVMPITKWRGKGFWTEWPNWEWPQSKERFKRIYTVATYHPAAVLRVPDLFRDMAGDIEKWASNEAPMPEPKLAELVCEKAEHVAPALKELIAAASNGYALISCDLETTGFSPISDSILAVGFGCEVVPQASRKRKGDPDGLSVVIPGRLLRSAAVRRDIYDLMTGKTFKGTLGLHNMKFDLQFLDMLFNEGIRPPRVIDSMLLSYLLDERPIGSQFAVHSLKSQARIRYDAADWMFDFDKHFKKTKTEQAAELKTMHHYQAQDLYYTARLCREMPEEAARDSERLMEIHDELLIPASFAFTEIELHGSRLDFPHLKHLQRQLEKASGALLDRLQQVAAKYELEEFNPGSSKQVGKLLYDTWHMPLQKVHGRKGSYTALSDKHGLNQLLEKLGEGEQKQFLEDLLEYRAVIKELNTYVIGFMELAKDDERIRSNFQLAGTVTGRLSSWKPNLQNIPVQRGNALRNAFIASDGYDFIAADFSQLEVRVAAALSDEEAWIEAFRKGYDLHKVVASQMLKKPQEDVTELERRMAKTVDFGILYGLGAKGLVDHEQIHKYRPKTVTLEEWHKRWNPKEAERFLNLFKTQFPKLTGWMTSLKKSARKNQFIESEIGRRRRFPLISERNWSEVERQAANMPIQSAASDICLLALIRLHEELPEGAYVLFSVHDAIYVECKRALTAQVLKQVKATMLSAVPDILGFEPKMPFDVKVEVGRCWAEGGEDWALAQKTGHKEKGGLNGSKAVAHARSRQTTG